MIAAAVFWPRLLHPGWSLDVAAQRVAVADAARTMVARYAVSHAQTT